MYPDITAWYRNRCPLVMRDEVTYLVLKTGSKCLADVPHYARKSTLVTAFIN